MNSEPQKEHRWLQQLVGDWECEGEAAMEPGKPPAKWKSTESVRSLGGLWVLCEGEGDMPGGGHMSSVITLGFDPKKGRYVGTFVASVMTTLWLYDGGLDEAGTTLTLDAEGPTMSGDGTTQYKDIVEIKSPDHRVLRSTMLTDDGQWVEIMRGDYRRKK
jgi:hypothetical protein